MKYLKLFENINSSYFKIDKDEFDSGSFGTSKRIGFSQIELDQLRKVCLELDSSIRIKTYEKDNAYINIESRSNDAWLCNINFVINKIDDEWYYVLDVPFPKLNEIQKKTYYKCDQLEGLIDCIKYEIFKK